MRRRAGIAFLLFCSLGLPGCGVQLRDKSLLERCGDLMQQAYPDADIEVTHKALVSRPTESLGTVIAQVEGERPKLPKDTGLPRDVAAECRFDDGVLTGFRWTKGPLR
ncbi:MAG TPA: hypothetical protein VE397_10245 [Stellaceae bacterium]|nr:hypothetical protein [Stellaceae bacterium]